MKPKNCLIFGASGQIGRHLIRKLTKNNYKVTAVTRNLHQKGYVLKTQGNAGYIDIVELNEAFASQSLACIKDLDINKKKINLDGGALALGHPLGATGARITGKAAELLKRENKKYALSTQCIGLGMGIATILESIN